MDNTTRLQYLEVMGIESWQLRQSQAIPDLTGFKNLSGLNPTALPSHEIPESQNPIPAEMPVIAAVVSQPVQPVMIPVDNWETLQNEVANCRKCELCQTRPHTVFGVGNHNAEWLFVGDDLSETDEKEQPFEGSAGLLLTGMLRTIDLNREQIFITPALKCRPPDDRKPKVAEMAACKPFLLRQVALLKPKIIIAVGLVAAQQLLDTQELLKSLRGKVYSANGIPLIVIYHPAYLLRSLSQKHKAWQDLQLALKTYQEIKGA